MSADVSVAALVVLNNEEWKYRAEGNRNLVLSLPKEGVVLRLLKEEKELVSQCKHEVAIHFLFVCNRYLDEIMRNVMGSEFVPKSDLIEISNIEDYKEQIDKFRPVSRKTKKLPTKCFGIRTIDCAIVLADVTRKFGCVIAVEIKPKMGFIPNSIHIPKNQEVKSKICKYQLMQRQKLIDGSIKEISNYCPVHLFSGDEEKMAYSLKCLLRNCQNNLRIFKDGDLTKVEDVLRYLFPDTLRDDSEDKFCRLLVQALLKIKSGNKMEFEECHLPQSSCTCDFRLPRGVSGGRGKSLPKNCILGRILSAQKKDCLDVEGVAPVYEYLLNRMDVVTNEMFYGLESIENLEYDLQEKIKIVQDFLIAATAKDCSVMVTIQEVESTQNIDDFLEINDRVFTYKTSVLDLDAKPHERIIEYRKQERKLVENYLNYG